MASVASTVLLVRSIPTVDGAVTAPVFGYTRPRGTGKVVVGAAGVGVRVLAIQLIRPVRTVLHVVTEPIGTK